MFYMKLRPEWWRMPPEYFSYHFGLKTTIRSPILDLNPEFWTSPPP